MKIQLVIVLAIIALVSYGSGQEQTKQTYCGRRLSQTLAWLCQSDYNLVKRSNYNSIDFGYEPEFSWPWLAAARARGFHDSRGLTDSRVLTDSQALSGPKGKRQGIVEECCLQPCTIEVLLTYCSN